LVFFLTRGQVMTLQGLVLRTLGGQGKTVGLLDRPYDVAVDAAGRMIVSDYTNQRLSVFDCDGTPQPPLHLPSKVFGVHYSHGQLVASLATGEIAVFDHM
jgi:DNA-binding beta-propeller fold protein YncE